MSAITKILEKLKTYPELTFEYDEKTISVTPRNGFTVWLTETRENITVGFNGWHEEFSTQDEAIDCFAFGLSDKCRLKIYKRGNIEYKWIVQVLHGNEWHDDSETGLLLFPFWRKKHVVFLSNSVTCN